AVRPARRGARCPRPRRTPGGRRRPGGRARARRRRRRRRARSAPSGPARGRRARGGRTPSSPRRSGRARRGRRRQAPPGGARTPRAARPGTRRGPRTEPSGASPYAAYDGCMPLSADAVHAALATVLDPEIRRPITDLKMVRSVDITEGATGPDGTTGASVVVGIDLTTAGCPLRDTITRDVTAAVAKLDGVVDVRVEMGVMTDEQRTELRTMLRGGAAEPVIPFAQPDSLTRVYAIASGKGGVGKSSVTANLAVAMAADGLSVGVVDADVYGFSIPGMLGIDQRPTKVDDMIIPPVAHGVKVISIGMFVPEGRPVVWRGPMLHRALQQFLADVFWGDLDVLLLDLPPGTGDIAISV